MIKVLCHNCCPSIPKGMITVEADCGLSDKQMEEVIDYHMKYCGGEIGTATEHRTQD